MTTSASFQFKKNMMPHIPTRVSDWEAVFRASSVKTSRKVLVADDLGQVFTGLRAVVEGKGKPLEVGEELPPQGVNQLAADTRGDVDLQVGEYSGKDGDQNDGDRDRQQRQQFPALKQSLQGREVQWERFFRQYVVEDDRQRPGSQQLHQRHTQHTYSGEEEAPLRSAEVVQYYLPKPREFGRFLWCCGRAGSFRGLLLRLDTRAVLCPPRFLMQSLLHVSSQVAFQEL
jgi:hypothetical protein